MANTIQYATILQSNLDKKMVISSVTGWMEANAGQVIYNGGKEVKIPKLSTDGLGDYDRTHGYTNGSINFGYETRAMSCDRGRSFSFDANDVDETNYVLTAGAVMATFQDEHVVPEVDAYRLSNLAKVAISTDNAVYSASYTKTTALDALKDGITKVRENGFTGKLMIHCTYDFKNLVSKALATQMTTESINVGGINIDVPSVDGCPLITTPSNRMVSGITLNDGKTGGQESGGFVKESSAIDMNFIIIAQQVPLAVCKTDKIRIFDPNTNQDANAWKTDYRKYHDIWVLDNKKNGIFASFKQAKPSQVIASALEDPETKQK